MKSQEIEERLAELRTEFGNLDVGIPDALEPAWLSSITDIEMDHDRQVFVATTD